ncbi:MAG: ATP-binding protein [Bacteroidales bacterium]
MEDDKSVSGDKDSKFLSSLTFQIAELEAGQDIVPSMLHSIWKHTNAVLGVFTQYNETQKAMVVKSIEGDGSILKAAIRVVGSKILETPNPLSDDDYVQIVGERIAISKSLTEISFGSIPKVVDIALKKVTGITKFYGVAHILSGKLYGTTLLAFRDNQDPPGIGLLNSFAYLTALSLRKNIAEKALIQKEANLRRITDNICDVVFTTDLNLKTTYVTPSIEKLTGETVEEYMSRSINELHPPETVTYLKSVLAQEFEREKDPSVDKNRSRIIEADFIKANGTVITISMHISFIRDDNGTPIGLQGVSRDITELKKAEQKLRDSNADKDRFMQILAHDLKNPIANLVSTSDLLQRYYQSYEKEKIEKFINLFSKVSNSTYNLLEDLLLWSKAQSGKLKPNIQRVDIKEICKNIMLEFNPMLNQKKISAQYPQEIFTIFADRNMIATVIRNLISNAIKFTKMEGEVIVAAVKSNDSITITVTDNGVGISPENQQKLWNFTSPHTTEGTANEKGTGFGLLICKEFLEMHGGKIWVESEAGKGSRFYVKLPQ